jgi:hypothetical protein
VSYPINNMAFVAIKMGRRQGAGEGSLPVRHSLHFLDSFLPALATSDPRDPRFSKPKTDPMERVSDVEDRDLFAARGDALPPQRTPTTGKAVLFMGQDTSANRAAA